MGCGLWVGVGLSWTDLRHEVSTGALGKSYTFSEVLIAHLIQCLEALDYMQKC